MSFSKMTKQQSFDQCVDCGKTFFEKKDIKRCKKCGKLLCTDCEYSSFGFCNQCRQEFEELSPTVKYDIMMKFKGALRGGSIFFLLFGVLFGISSLILMIIFLVRNDRRILGILAASGFLLSVLFFWIARKYNKKFARNFQEVERRIVEFKNQIQPEGPRQNRSYSTQYRQTSSSFKQQTVNRQKNPSEIPIRIHIDPEMKKKATYKTLWFFAFFLMIAGIIHLGLFFSGILFFGFISFGEISVSILLIWLGKSIKRGRVKGKLFKLQSSSNRMQGERPYQLQNERPIPGQTNSPKQGWLLFIYFFIFIIGLAALIHSIIFLSSSSEYSLFGALGGIEIIITLILIWISKKIKTRLNNTHLKY